MNTTIVVIAHNIRSTHNVGSFFRTCDGFGVAHLYLTGYTPYPAVLGDARLPHITSKLTAQIHKTALGAEQTLPFSYAEDPLQVVAKLQQDGYELLALEQTPTATMLPEYTPTHAKIALLLGEEVHGIPPEILAAADSAIEIPMQGTKESFNVSVALGIALYGLSISH
ncbi:MAG TPA: TrmH family RNA methyltransferase [Candidatus Saccharimonadales bacterium]|nr:TrmH family RNA methyltransferase [Candidatus Saccharimonadales bacterium]